LGRTTRTVHSFEGQSKAFTTAYGYPQNQVLLSLNNLGTVPISQTFPDNERVDYTYDAGGTQQSINTTPSGGQRQTIISGVLRNSRGQTIAATYGNGAISIYQYRETTDLRLGQIQTAVGAALTIVNGLPQLTGGTTLQNYGYSFDNNGNVIGITDNLNSNLSATYTYDSLDQLKSMTSVFAPPISSTKSYAYDNLGNLKTKEDLAQTYGGANRGPHALATAQGLTYNYDLNGNLIETRDGSNNVVTSITWNSENMPTKFVQSGITLYQKFFLGESLWKKVEPSGTTYYLPSMRI
jgi:YD repeat-containing protein